MKQLFILCFSAYVLNCSAQTFSLVNSDTIDYAPIGGVPACHTVVKNNSSTGYYVDVIRLINDTAPNWNTAFCVDVCYPPTTDSARFYLLPDSSQTFLLEFFSDTLPDSSTALIKFKNVSNPANFIVQRFYGITSLTFGVNNWASDNLLVSTFPSPVSPGRPVCFRITDKQSADQEYTLVIYDIRGSSICRFDKLINGDNYLMMDLTGGLYLYTLIKGSSKIKTGKLAVAR